MYAHARMPGGGSLEFVAEGRATTKTDLLSFSCTGRLRVTLGASVAGLAADEEGRGIRVVADVGVAGDVEATGERDAGELVDAQVEGATDVREGAKGDAGELVVLKVEVATDGREGAKGDSSETVVV